MGNGSTGPAPQVVVPGVGWVDVATRAITQVGFPVVIAGVLLWFVLGKFQGNMELITARMAANTDAANALVRELQTQTTEMRQQTLELKQQTLYARDIARHLAVQRNQPPPDPSPGAP